MVKKISFLIALGLAAFVTSPAWAAAFGVDAMFGVPSSVSCSTNPGSPQAWISLAFVAMAVSAMISAGAMTLSGVLGTQKLWDYMKGSVWSFVEGAAILSILSIAFVGLNQYGVGNIDKARAYSVIIRNTLMLDFASMVFASTIFSFFASAQPTFRPFGEKIGAYISFQAAPMFRPIFDLLGLIIQLQTVAILEWFAHEFMLCFVKNQMLTILLPAGFFLRQFGLKAGGNALIGISLALYFAYPLMLVQTGEIITQHFQDELSSLQQPTATEDPSTYDYAHMWGCSINRPICCLPANMGAPTNFSQPYLRNGNDYETNLNSRVSVNNTLMGPIYLSFDSAGWPAASAGASCVFTTNFARVVKPVIDSISGLPLWGLAVGAGIAGFGVPAFFKIMMYMNLSWLVTVLVLPMTAIVLSFTYEMVYFVFIISMVMSIFIIFITLTLAKEIAKVLGTEIDLSALEKLI